ncbi:MAG TPA: ATP-binding protein [Chitinophagaceae bacterium]|nr:ATP-binding protein [Chitinophagaceae bacterium]
MTFKRYQLFILLRIVLLVISITGFAYLLVNGYYSFAVGAFILVVVLVFSLFFYINKNNEELEQFVEAIHYRDFSRHFDVKHAPLPVKDLRKGFNEINSTVKLISREREAQFHYLQRILELVDTGILSYQTESGEVSWMNESFKQMIGIPYLSTIHSLEKRNAEVYREILDLKSGQQKVIKVNTDKLSFKILVAATSFQTEGKLYKLVAFQNVNEALDENEAEAWKKLLSVMTHEIMNSIAPISSLADTLKKRMQQSKKGDPGNAITIEDLELGIETIRKRSEGLLKFAETYRNLNKITAPNLKKVYIRDLFENLHHLMQPTLDEKKIELDIILKDPDLSLMVDTNLIEQVLINLVVNAIEAVKEKAEGKIQLSAYITPNNKIVVKVADNGGGIPDDVIDKIFIPFFSTRKTGSGIGLSLCKQIMMLHKGNIQVKSVQGEGTVFTLMF